jgi:hypothetical protein
MLAMHVGKILIVVLLLELPLGILSGASSNWVTYH